MTTKDSTTAQKIASETRSVDPQEFITLTLLSGITVRIRPKLVLAITELAGGVGSGVQTSVGFQIVKESPAEVERLCVERSVQRWTWHQDDWALAGAGKADEATPTTETEAEAAP
jgi:hypothetical protein